MSTLIHSTHPAGIMRDAVERIESLRSDHSKMHHIIGFIHFSIISVSVIILFLQSDPQFLSITEDMSLLSYQVIPVIAGMGLTFFKPKEEIDEGTTIEVCPESECKQDNVRDELEKMKRELIEKEAELEKMRRKQFEDITEQRLQNLENMICHTSHDQNISKTPVLLTTNDTSNHNPITTTPSPPPPIERVTRNVSPATSASRAQCYEERTMVIRRNMRFMIHDNR